MKRNRVLVSRHMSKQLKDVQDAHIFLEGMGASGSAGSSSVKVENPAYVRVNSVKDALKSKP